MADTTPNPSLEYDHRRAARGGDSPIQASKWKRRLWTVGLVLATLVVLAVASYTYYVCTYVTTVQASVHCELVELASDVDARLAELYVVPSDTVKKGDPVARLDDTQLAAALEAAKADLAVRESDLTRGRAQLDILRAQIESAIELAKAQVSVASASLERTEADRDHYKAQLPEQIRRAQAQRDQSQALDENFRKGTRPERIAALKARLAAAKNRRDFYKIDVEAANKLAKGGVISNVEMEQKLSLLSEAENALTEAELNLKLAQAGPTAEEVRASEKGVDAQDAALALTKTGAGELRRLAAEVKVCEAQLLDAKAQEKRAQARRFEIKLAEERIKAAEAEVAKAKATVDQREANLKSKTICSPVDGTVLRTFGEVGEVCKKGEPIVFVRDDSQGHWIEGFVSEADAYRLRPKQKATVATIAGAWEFIPAYVDLVSLSTSSVERRAVVATGSARPPSRGEQVWVKIRFEKEPKPEELLLLPGMSARAFIRVR